MDNFKLWRPFKVLPTAFDESLSYYEAICKISEKVNEALEYIYDFGTSVIGEANQYTDQQIAALRNQIQNQIAGLEKKYDTKFTEYDAKIVELNVTVSALYTAWAEYQGVIDQRFKFMYSDLIRYIDEHMGSISQVYVISPVTGNYEPLQKVLNDIYNTLNIGALTALQYDDMELEASTYDKLQLTAEEYDGWARYVPQFFKYFYLRMRSPFTGKMELYEKVINDLAYLHKKALTAAGYDGKGLTATGYDDRAISAYNYDWDAETLLA